jgi:hypothetical protein
VPSTPPAEAPLRIGSHTELRWLSVIVIDQRANGVGLEARRRLQVPSWSVAVDVAAVPESEVTSQMALVAAPVQVVAVAVEVVALVPVVLPVLVVRTGSAAAAAVRVVPVLAAPVQSALPTPSAAVAEASTFSATAPDSPPHN